MEHILVVEDEPIIARDIEDSLHSAGYAVAAVASSGEEALNKIPLTQPDLVLMDIVLKGRVDGLEAAAVIRARFDIPVVFLTGYADESTLERAKLTCPSGYLLKPFNDRELQVTISMALYKHVHDRQERIQAEWFGAALRSLREAVIATDQAGRLRFANRAAEVLIECTQEEALGRPLVEILRVAVEPVGTVEMVAKDGRRRRLTVTPATITDEQERAAGTVYLLHELSGDATRAEGPERTDSRAAESSAPPRSLCGLIPICASCKKMRNEQGAWQQPEIYIRERTAAEFTHGICPECMRRLYKLTRDHPSS